jgi:hypothetical protein
MQKVVIKLDEMKPHWIENQGLDIEAKAIGLKSIKISANDDQKITYIRGEVEDFDVANENFKGSRFAQIATFSKSL